MRRALGFGGRLVVRLFTLLVVAIILVLLALLVMGAITTQRGWPQTTGTIALGGLDRPVTVVRDFAGIIHITADTPHDLFMAQGYVHAQERMWSGNAFDPHSIDQVPLWIAGESVGLPFSEANVLANAAQTLTLTP